jgi:hypothetical protein
VTVVGRGPRRQLRCGSIDGRRSRERAAAAERVGPWGEPGSVGPVRAGRGPGGVTSEVPTRDATGAMAWSVAARTVDPRLKAEVRRC